MATKKTEVEYYRGDSYSKEFTVTDEETGAAIPLTGQVLTMYVDTEKNPGLSSTTELFQLVGTITDEDGGKVTFTPSSDNNDLDPLKYYYRIKMSEGLTIRTVIRDRYIII